MTTMENRASRASGTDPARMQLLGRILGGAFWTVLVLLVCVSAGLLC